MNSSRQRRNPRLFRLAAMFIGCFLVVQSTQDVAAQDTRPRRSEVTINVSYADNQCRYEIVDYPDQDVFRIEPGGKVNFTATLTDISVDIERQDDKADPNNPNNGKQGVENRADRSFELAAGNSRTVAAKTNNGAKTVHKVWIVCIVNGAEKISESGPSLDDGSLGVRRIPAVRVYRGQREAERTGQADAEDKTKKADPARASGGPGMEIDPDE